jgi:hypothetical protein
MPGNGYLTTWQKGQFEPDPFVATGAGMVAGVVVTGVVGHATNLTTGTTYDLYENAATVPLYPWFTAAHPLQIASASANDTVAGSGARRVTLTGLDANYNLLQETLVTNGVTPVITTNSFLRLNKAEVTLAGTLTGSPNAGDITVAQSGGANVQAIIRAGFGIGASGVYTVAAGMSAVVTLVQFSLAGAGAANFAQVGRADNGGGAMSIGLRFDINSGFPFEQAVPGEIFLPSKTDTAIRVISVGQASSEVAGLLNITLFDNSYLS